MTDTAKGLVLGLILGAGITLAGGAAVMMLVVTPKTNAAIAAQEQKCAVEKKAVASTAATAWRDVINHRQIQSPGFTALLEPAPAKSSAALQLFDVVRPGLGTMLAKLQAAQSQQISVVWVVEGRVKPASSVPGSSYCWLNASGEVESCQAVSQ